MSVPEPIALKRLPSIELRARRGVIRLDAPELGSIVLLLVRDARLEQAKTYIAALEQRLKDIRDWSGRVVLITESDVAGSGVPSATATAAQWEALTANRSALIIADRWGLVYFAQHTTTFNDLPSADDIVAWVRYLGTQCPECGVMDEPGHGEWGE